MKHCLFCCRNYRTESDVCEECGGHLVKNVGWNLGFLFAMLSALVMLLIWASIVWRW